MKSPFNVTDGPILVQHRALNSIGGFQDAHAVRKTHPHIPQAAEGDICWLENSDGSFTFFFWHPRAVSDLPKRDEIPGLIEAGDLVSIEHPLFDEYDGFFILELKLGYGDNFKALAELCSIASRRFSGRFWIDGFSRKLTRIASSHLPDTPITLHTEKAFPQRVLSWAPEWPTMGFPLYEELDWVDAVSLRYHGSGKQMRRGMSHICRSAKNLVVSLVDTEDRLRTVMPFSPLAVYSKCDPDTFARERDRAAVVS